MCWAGVVFTPCALAIQLLATCAAAVVTAASKHTLELYYYTFRLVISYFAVCRSSTMSLKLSSFRKGGAMSSAGALDFPLGAIDSPLVALGDLDRSPGAPNCSPGILEPEFMDL